MKVMDIMQTGTYEKVDEEKLPIIKNMLGRGAAVNTNIHKFWKKSRKNVCYTRLEIWTTT